MNENIYISHLIFSIKKKKYDLFNIYKFNNRKKKQYI